MRGFFVHLNYWLAETGVEPATANVSVTASQRSAPRKHSQQAGQKYNYLIDTHCFTVQVAVLILLEINLVKNVAALVHKRECANCCQDEEPHYFL